MIVSITDQLAMVWPTVIPKYSLTSQNPASLTCEKNSDPAPTASASRATVGWSSPAASGATMPAAGEWGGGGGGLARPAARGRDDPRGGDGGARRGAGRQPDGDGDQPAEDQ